MKSKLYLPGKIAGLELKNRIVMTAMHSALSNDGEVNRPLTEYFVRRAEGGAGLIIVGAAGIDPKRVNTHNVIGIYNDRFIPGLTGLTRDIHSHGSRCMVQLFHPGRYGKSAEYGGVTAVAPSPVPSRFTGETPRELSEKEIGEIIRAYGAAALRARKAGFDGVEVTAASGYLPAQFLSPLTNRRADRYGGDLEGRLTFLLELIDEIHIEAGSDFPLVVRIGWSDLVEGGNGPEESLKIAAALEKAGVDAISVTGGWHESPVPQLTMDVPHGVFSTWGRKIRKTVSIPVILSNRMTPLTAENLIDSESVDFIGFARPFLADPRWPRKAEEGLYQSIRPCIACNQGCMDRIFFGKTIACLVNREAGREWESSEVRGKENKSILVVGGGIGGLNFAINAAESGYKPTIWEKSSSTGGQALIAAGLEERKEIARYASYLTHSCREKNIPLMTNREGRREDIIQAVKSGEFDSVVLALGKDAAPSDLETDGSLPVIHGWDILREKPAPGRRVIIRGGNALAVWTALKFASRGKMTAPQLQFFKFYNEPVNEEFSDEITLIEPDDKIGKSISPSSKWVYISMLKKMGVNILKGYEISSISCGAVQITDREGKGRKIESDIVIETGTFTSRADELSRSLIDEGIEVLQIGSSLGFPNMFSAVRTAYDAVLSMTEKDLKPENRP